LDRLAVTGGGRPDLDKFADSIGYVEMDLAPLAALSHLKILESTTSTDLAALAGLRLEHLTVDVAGDSLAALSTQTALKTLSILCKYCESFRLPSLPNLTVLQATAGFDEAPLVLPQSLIDLHLQLLPSCDTSS
jgi:hypothetical protein